MITSQEVFCSCGNLTPIANNMMRMRERLTISAEGWVPPTAAPLATGLEAMAATEGEGGSWLNFGKEKKKKRGRGRQLRRGGKLLVWCERKGRGRGRKWVVLIPKALGLCTPAICRRPLYFFSAILAIVHYCQAVVNRKLGGEQSSFGPTSPFGLRVVGRSAGTHPSHPTDFNRSQNFPPNKITVKTMSRSNLLSVAFQSSHPGFFAPSQCLAVAA